MIMPATTYGSTLAFGRRSSSQPFFAFSTAHGIRTDAPRSEAPQLKLL